MSSTCAQSHLTPRIQPLSDTYLCSEPQRSQVLKLPRVTSTTSFAVISSPVQLIYSGYGLEDKTGRNSKSHPPCKHGAMPAHWVGIPGHAGVSQGECQGPATGSLQDAGRNVHGRPQQGSGHRPKDGQEDMRLQEHVRIQELQRRDVRRIVLLLRWHAPLGRGLGLDHHDLARMRVCCHCRRHGLPLQQGCG